MFSELKVRVRNLIVKEDALGLKPRPKPLLNAFCPTGPGGGQDPTCGPGEGHYPKAGKVVDGRKVLDKVPNTDSIAASLDDYEVLPGIREVQMSAFPGLTGHHYNAQDDDRIGRLAQQIDKSKTISPLIVVEDKDGPYILEGGHRSEALYRLKAKSFPALVVRDKTDVENAFCPTGPGGGQDNTCGGSDWKRPKVGKPSKTIYDSWTSSDLIKRRDELERDMKQLGQTGWTDEFRLHEATGLTADIARGNYRTLALEHAKVEAAYHYVRVKTERTENVFCPTGPGGGVDPTCSPGGGGADGEKGQGGSGVPKEPGAEARSKQPTGADATKGGGPTVGPLTDRYLTERTANGDFSREFADGFRSALAQSPPAVQAYFEDGRKNNYPVIVERDPNEAGLPPSVKRAFETAQAITVNNFRIEYAKGKPVTQENLTHELAHTAFRRLVKEAPEEVKEAYDEASKFGETALKMAFSKAWYTKNPPANESDYDTWWSLRYVRNMAASVKRYIKRGNDDVTGALELDLMLPPNLSKLAEYKGNERAKEAGDQWRTVAVYAALTKKYKVTVDQAYGGEELVTYKAGKDRDYAQRLFSKLHPVSNVFCPTGPGGGIDPTCPGGGGGHVQEVSDQDRSWSDPQTFYNAIEYHTGPVKEGINVVEPYVYMVKDGKATIQKDLDARYDYKANVYKISKRELPPERVEDRVYVHGGDIKLAGAEELKPGKSTGRFGENYYNAIYLTQKGAGTQDRWGEHQYEATLEPGTKLAKSHADVVEAMKKHPDKNEQDALEAEGYHGVVRYLDPRGDVTELALFKNRLKSVRNAFCPTGKGGGVDPHCPPGGEGKAGEEADDRGTRDNPIYVGKDIEKAARLLAQGKHIQLDQPDQVATLLDKMAKMARKAAELGEKAPNFDLCKVSVPKTNLFCQDNLGIPRAEMPQLRGQAKPGSYAASLPASKSGKVDLTYEFLKELDRQGIKVEETDIRASHLRASQREIVGARVAELVNEAKAGKRDLREKPMFVTRDNYVVDGHHHWAAIVGLGHSKGKDLKVPVYKLDMDIGRAITLANEFAKAKGLLPKSATSNTRWEFHTDPEKVKAFQAWLRQQLDHTVRGLSQEELWKRYVEAGLKKGAARSFDDVKKPYAKGYAADESTAGFYKGSKEQFLKDSFRQPVAVEKAELLAGRAFDELENVTDDMSTKMSRVLTDGLVQGKSPEVIAKDLNREVDLGQKRSMLIARTEIIRAHAEGQLLAMENLGVDQVGVQVEWSTAKDELVCPECEDMEGTILSVEEAHGMIPLHPNCRCAWIPAVDVEDKGEQPLPQAARPEQEEEGEEETTENLLTVLQGSPSSALDRFSVHPLADLLAEEER
jgi:SPP1 gp7 family putative phage head morphogenesis protein